MSNDGKGKNQRAGFTFYRSFRDAVELTDKDDQLVLYKAIADYALDGIEPDISAFGALGRLCWTAISPNIKSGLKNFHNGCAGGAPKGNKNARKTTLEQPQDGPKFNPETTEKQPKFNRKTSNTFIDENENGDVNGNVDEKGDCKGNADKPRKVATKFVAPSLEEVRSYISEKGFTDIDPETFIDHYTANGWKVGKTPMKDWKAAIRNWNRKRNDFTSTNKQTSTSYEPKPQYKQAL